MPITRANVLVGIGTFSLDGADVGSTAGGVEITKNLTYHEKRVDQFLDAIDMVPTDVSMTVRTTIAEATQENLQDVWSEKNAPVGVSPAKTLELGVDTVVHEHTLAFTGRSPVGVSALRTYSAFRAVPNGSSGHSIRKDDQVGLPVEFRILPDLTKAEGEEYGTIVE